MKIKDLIVESAKTKYAALLFKLNDNDPGDPDVINCSKVSSLKDIDFAGLKKNIGLYMHGNSSIKNLDGGPKVLNGTLFVEECDNFESLSGTIEEVYPHETFIEAINIDGCPKLKSLKDIHKHFKVIKGEFSCSSDIESNVLGLLKIKGLTKVWFPNQQACKIINKYLPEGDILECQDELIDANLSDFAKL